MLEIPNLPAPECPDGASEADNVVTPCRRVSIRHGLLASTSGCRTGRSVSELGILDVERAVKLSGSMFVMYRRQGAALVRALCQLALDRNVDLYEEIRPPTLVRTDTMVATGHLPKFVDEAYHVERDDLWAIPTAEVPLTSLARDEILARGRACPGDCVPTRPASGARPVRPARTPGVCCGCTSSTRWSCSPTADRTRPRSCTPRSSHAPKALIAELGLPYRVLDLCAGDIGASARRTFDIEVYSPGVDAWLEVSSVSWFGDYQARRANLRYRPERGRGTEMLHTLNGSALAVPRVWAALVETWRRPDGTVEIPGPLRPYMRGAETIA